MSDRILNLTQHEPTPDQLAAGVFNPMPEDWQKVKALMTFDEPTPPDDRVKRAIEIARLARGQFGDCEAVAVMLGGAPYFMPQLEGVCLALGYRVLYSFTKRDMVETPQPDGSVKKTQVFRHVGWVEA